MLDRRQLAELRAAHRVVHQLEHGLLALRMLAQQIEVGLQGAAHHRQHVAGRLERSAGDEFLLVDDEGDDLADQFVTGTERVVEAGQRHPGLRDDRAGRRGVHAVPGDDGQRRLHQRGPAVVGCESHAHLF